MNIIDSPEYLFADEELRFWVSKQNKVPEMKFDNFKEFKEVQNVKINTNKGMQIVPMKLTIDNMNYVVPDFKMERGQYLVKGRSIYGARSIFFSYNDFLATDVAHAVQKKIDTKKKHFAKQYSENLVAELRNKLPDVAKEALKDNVVQFFNDKNFEAVHRWFAWHQFENIPSIETFSKMQKFGIIFLEEKTGAYGRSYGTYMEIDWKNKKFVVRPFSSQ